jgi:hypothetical protein
VALLEQDKARYQKLLSPDGAGLEGPVGSDSEGKSIEELRLMSEKIMSEIKAKKLAVQPQLDRRKDLRKQFEEVEQDWKGKKNAFENTTSKVNDEINEARAALKKVKDEVYAHDTKISLAKYRTELLELKTARLDE